MRIACWRERLFAFSLLLLAASPALSSTASVEPLFDLRTPQTAPFPSNRFTAFDLRNLTNLRVNLPKPDCALQPSDCVDVDVLNTLDGFNLQPRLRIPFSGAIDPASVNKSNLFLVRLDDTTRLERPRREVVGINQVVWDPASNTLFAESDELLEQHTVYALIVTNGIRDANGKAIRGGDFGDFFRDLSAYRHRDLGMIAYRASLLGAIARSGVSARNIVAASVFTTLSVTSDLEKIRNQIKRSRPAPADFVLASDGSRTVFPVASLAGAVVARQVGTAPTFQNIPQALPALNVVPNSVSTLAYGRISSPDYETAQQFIPPINTRSGVPVRTRTNNIFFDLILPAGPKPAAGWPVAVFGHGFGGSKDNVLAVASVLASRGIATIAINVVGHGGGALGTLTVSRVDGTSVTLPSGGRGIDQNGDTNIDGTEGVNAAPPRTIIGNRDGLRQTVIDLMQLIRVIESGGIDVEGDGVADLSRERIYYFGISFGGIYGTMLLGVEPSIRAGVPNVPGGSIVDLARLGGFRATVAAGLAARTPVLLNALPFAPPLFGFNENMPLRNQPVVINNVPGAIAIQDFLDRTEWVSDLGNPVTYAPHIRKDPLRGLDAKPVIVQFAKGDMTVPNPSNTALIRAGELTDRATYFRNDLAVAANPAVPRNPHSFLVSFLVPGSGAAVPFGVAAQTQIAVFFASDGATVIDPDGAGPIFETPIAGPLPEELNFLQ
jgi:hypothetical protein